MKSLTKKQVAERNQIASDLDTAFEAVEQAVEQYNDKLSAARDFRDDIVSQMDDYASDRSEKWPESETGQAFAEWKSQWEDGTLEDISLDEAPHGEFQDWETERG